jgi:hypothetical protein
MESDEYISVARDMIEKLELTVADLKEEVAQLKADKEAWHQAALDHAKPSRGCGKCGFALDVCMCFTPADTGASKYCEGNGDGCCCGRPQP